MLFENWLDALAETTTMALLELWRGFLSFIPDLIAAIIIFLIGWVLAVFIGKLIAEILTRIKLNQFFERAGWKTALEKAEMKINPSDFIGAIVKWILVITFLYAAVGVLGVPFAAFQDLLGRILAYLPNVVVAALIFVVAVIIADIVEKIVRAAVEGIKVGYGHLVGVIVKWAIWIFAILAILYQLGIARPFMETLFQGIVAMLVISLGISFGLGGKDVAAEMLQDLKKKLRG
jgi:hypothetical protein